MNVFILSHRQLRIIALAVFMLITTIPHSYAEASLYIITNQNSDISELSSNEVRQIYMGGTLSRKLNAISLPVDSSIRKNFNVSIIGLTENRIQSYWAQLFFTGRSSRPKELKTLNEVVDYISSEVNVVAYVPANVELPSNVVVLFQR